MSQRLKFKKKKTLQHLLLMAIGILGLIVGLVGYFWAGDFVYFYILIGGNALIAYGFLVSQIRKNRVVHDLVFIKYRLNDGEVQRINLDHYQEVQQEGSVLKVSIQNEGTREIDLRDYDRESVEEFEALLHHYDKKKASLDG